MTPTSQAHITCLCGAIREEGSLLQAEFLPLPSDLCLCNTCRRTSGGLWSAGDRLKGKPQSIAKCTAYPSSKEITRYFCSTCGSQIFMQNSDGWFAYAGCLEQSPESKRKQEPWPHDLLKVDYLGYAGDTQDFKHPALLMTLQGAEVPVYRQGPDQNEMAREEIQALAKAPPSVARGPSDVLQAQCHCGSVSLQIRRHTWETDREAGYIPPDGHKDKYVAGFCACRSCRLGIGASSLCPWVYVPPENVFTADGQPVNFSVHGPSAPGLQDHRSTAGEVRRSFCKTCGASFFWWSDGRPQVVDIAAGILRAPEGLAASNWLWWRSRLSSEEENTDRQIVDVLRGDGSRAALF